jgi:hypothetical protein
VAQKVVAKAGAPRSWRRQLSALHFRCGGGEWEGGCGCFGCGARGACGWVGEG